MCFRTKSIQFRHNNYTSFLPTIIINSQNLITMKKQFKLKLQNNNYETLVEGIYLDTISTNNSVKNDIQLDLVYYNSKIYYLDGYTVIKSINII